MSAKHAWVTIVLAAILAQAGMAQPAAASVARKPKAFPGVATTRGAPVCYGTVALDTWTGRVAYLLVEGNTSNGFTRIFAWIPGDARLDRPAEWKPKPVEANPNAWFFGELENKDSEGDEKVAVQWRFSSVKNAHGAGSDSYVDYLTGKTVARNWGAATWHAIVYNVKFGYAFGKKPSGSMDGSLPLEMTRGGEFPLYDSWAKVPEPGGFGFDAQVQAKIEMQETRDPKVGRLMCQFSGFNGSTIQKAPSDLPVTLLVSPYMGAPIASNNLSIAEFMKSGFDLDIPYGWYSLQIRGFHYGRFTIGGFFPGINIDPVPLTRPVAGGF